MELSSIMRGTIICLRLILPLLNIFRVFISGEIEAGNSHFFISTMSLIHIALSEARAPHIVSYYTL